MKKLSLILAISALYFCACEKSCSKKLEIKPQKTAEQKQDEQKKEPLIKAFPDLNLTGLSETKIASLTKLLNEEVCPCGCPKTFAQCITMPGCKPGVLLAQWAADQLKEGAPEHYLYKAISEEINSGYLAPAKQISTFDAHKKGNDKAKMVIVEFADFECPACKMASLEMKEFLKGRNDVVLYFMHFPLNVHPHAEEAAVAAEAAGLQGKFWEMHDLLFAQHGPLSTDIIKSLAQKIFNPKQMAQFQKDLTNPKLKEKVMAHKEYGQNELKLMSTPTFLWNGRPYNLSSAKEAYNLRLLMEKARNEISCK